MKITRTRILSFLGVILLWVSVLYITSGSHVTANSDISTSAIQGDQVLEKEASLIEKNDPQTEVTLVHPKEVRIVRERCGDFWCYTGEQFLKLYDRFESRSGLRRLGKYIYNQNKLDAYLINKAIGRGYQRRVFAHEDDIVSFEGIYTRPEVRDAFVAMRSAMNMEVKETIHFVSGYRNSTKQRGIVVGKLGKLSETKALSGGYDAHIDDVLKVSALPGFSKHHSGYAADFGCGESQLVFSFATTPCYDWLSKDNFENAKRFGFIPSYPNEVNSQGPNPEPWEFVWVGVESLN